MAALSATHRAAALQSRLFAALPAELQPELLAAARVTRHPRGTSVFHQGDRARVMHIVAEGWVKLYRLAPSGAEAVVGVMTRGQSLVEPIALRGTDYPVSAEAVTDCALIALPSEALLAQIRTRPEVAISILSSTFQHLQGLVRQIEQLKARSGAQRVAEFLLDLCPDGAEAATVTLPYDKALIAGRLGMKPESLSRAFARLRGHGVIVQQTSAAIASVAALREVVHADPAGPWARAV